MRAGFALPASIGERITAACRGRLLPGFGEHFEHMLDGGGHSGNDVYKSASCVCRISGGAKGEGGHDGLLSETWIGDDALALEARQDALDLTFGFVGQIAASVS
jgi:hypothetical protein